VFPESPCDPHNGLGFGKIKTGGAMVKLAVCLLFVLVPNFSFATDLVYISRDASVIRREKLVDIRVMNGKQPTVEMHAGLLGCAIVTKTIEEAYKVQEQALSGKLAEIQCFGDYTSPNGKDSIYLATDSYSVGALMPN
jgi:hypothetical protein